MCNKIKNILFGFILGILLSTMIGVGAVYLYNAKEIEFVSTNSEWNVTNVHDAMNDLYNEYQKETINIPIINFVSTASSSRTECPEATPINTLSISNSNNFSINVSKMKKLKVGKVSNVIISFDGDNARNLLSNEEIDIREYDKITFQTALSNSYSWGGTVKNTLTLTSFVNDIVITNY